MSKFKDSVVKIVKLIPAGQVASYGQVSLYVGVPRAARQVGWILNGLEGNTPVPWWRVVNSQGRITIKGSRYSQLEQKELLEAEGVKINDDFTFDIEQYRFKPDEELIAKFELDKAYLEMIAQKLPYGRIRIK